MSEFPKKDVGAAGYLTGGCPNCGRARLELYVDGDDERAVGVACEKCGAQWLLDPAKADFHGEQSTTNPLKPRIELPSPFEDEEGSGG